MAVKTKNPAPREAPAIGESFSAAQVRTRGASRSPPPYSNCAIAASSSGPNPKPLALLRPASAATLPRQTVVDPGHGPKTYHSFGTVVNTLSRSEYFTRPAIGRATARCQRIVI